MSAITRFPSIALILSLPISLAPLLTISLVVLSTGILSGTSITAKPQLWSVAVIRPSALLPAMRFFRFWIRSVRSVIFCSLAATLSLTDSASICWSSNFLFAFFTSSSSCLTRSGTWLSSISPPNSWNAALILAITSWVFLSWLSWSAILSLHFDASRFASLMFASMLPNSASASASEVFTWSRSVSMSLASFFVLMI